MANTDREISRNQEIPIQYENKQGFKGLPPSDCLPSWSTFASRYPKLMPVSLGIAAGIVAVGWLKAAAVLSAFHFAKLCSGTAMVTNQSRSDAKQKRYVVYTIMDSQRLVPPRMCLGLFQNYTLQSLGQIMTSTCIGWSVILAMCMRYSTRSTATVHNPFASGHVFSPCAPMAASGALETLIKAAPAKGANAKEEITNPTRT